MERSMVGSKKGNEDVVGLVNHNILRFSFMSRMEDRNIPEWLLVEVLVRLPVKYVFRFKLVSRMWLSVISDPYFVPLYVSRASLLSRQPWTIVSYGMRRKDSQFSHLNYELLKDLYVKPRLFVVGVPSMHQPREDEKYLICSVSNGLVFYCRYTGLSYAYADLNYCICNPLTGHCIALPPLACRFQSYGWGFHTHVEDGVVKSYRVVGIERPIQGSNRLKFQVYVSEIGEWKEFTVPGDFFPLYIYKPAAVLNGILHWLAKGHGIIAYDPYQNPENMHLIGFPDDSVGHDECSCSCVEYRGKLRYFKVGDLSMPPEVAFPSFKVWVLNDYTSGDWCLQHNISREDVQYNANFPSRRFSIGPMCFHPFDSDIVYLGCDGHCVSYSLKTRELQVEDEFFMHSETVFKIRPPHWWMFLFLYMVPHWPTSIPLPSHGAIEA